MVLNGPSRPVVAHELGGIDPELGGDEPHRGDWELPDVVGEPTLELEEPQHQGEPEPGGPVLVADQLPVGVAQLPHQ